MNLDLYVITDEGISGGRSHVEIARNAIDGGADVIQLREKFCACRDMVRAGREISCITRKAGALFIVNDRLDVALACGADGVHLGQGDIRIDTARQLAPRKFIIGVSVGSAEEAEEAILGGADYIAVSPVFETRSKDDAGPGHGLSLITAIRRRTRVPVIAIGGIDESNVREVIAAGAAGIAVISAVVGKPDISRAARDLRATIRKCKLSLGKNSSNASGRKVPGSR
jgi:thiamine-phosphate pyrophosphorylase